MPGVGSYRVLHRCRHEARNRPSGGRPMVRNVTLPVVCLTALCVSCSAAGGSSFGGAGAPGGGSGNGAATGNSPANGPNMGTGPVTSAGGTSGGSPTTPFGAGAAGTGSVVGADAG